MGYLRQQRRALAATLAMVVATTILSVAYESFADVIAMGVREKKDVPFTLRSTVTYKVIAGAQCPVLITHLH